MLLLHRKPDYVTEVSQVMHKYSADLKELQRQRSDSLLAEKPEEVEWYNNVILIAIQTQAWLMQEINDKLRVGKL